MRLTVTGHRPDKLFDVPKQYAYTVENYMHLVAFCKKLVTHLKSKDASVEFNIGMALGFDMAMAEACSDLGVPFYAYVPFRGQELKWRENWQTRYNLILAQAKEIIIVTDTTNYHEGHMINRNKRMVKDCDKVISLWNGDRFGGTTQCVGYANSLCVEVVNYWDHWLKYKANANIK